MTLRERVKVAANEDAQIWEQQPQESAIAFAAFRAYPDMGPERSTRKVAAALGKYESQITGWSVAHRCVARAGGRDHSRGAIPGGHRCDAPDAPAAAAASARRRTDGPSHLGAQSHGGGVCKCRLEAGTAGTPSAGVSCRTRTGRSDLGGDGASWPGTRSGDHAQAELREAISVARHRSGSASAPVADALDQVTIAFRTPELTSGEWWCGPAWRSAPTRADPPGAAPHPFLLA